MKRFMSDKELAEFAEEYDNVLMHGRRINRASDKDMKIAKMLKEHQNYSKVAKMLGISSAQVMVAVGRVYATK